MKLAALVLVMLLMSACTRSPDAPAGAALDGATLGIVETPHGRFIAERHGLIGDKVAYCIVAEEAAGRFDQDDPRTGCTVDLFPGERGATDGSSFGIVVAGGVLDEENALVLYALLVNRTPSAVDVDCDDATISVVATGEPARPALLTLVASEESCGRTLSVSADQGEESIDLVVGAG